jgi:hypothetical protein
MFLVVKSGRRVGLQPYRLLSADCLKNVGASISHNPMDFNVLLQGSFTFVFFTPIQVAVLNRTVTVNPARGMDV